MYRCEAVGRFAASHRGSGRFERVVGWIRSGAVAGVVVLLTACTAADFNGTTKSVDQLEASSAGLGALRIGMTIDEAMTTGILRLGRPGESAYCTGVPIAAEPRRDTFFMQWKGVDKSPRRLTRVDISAQAQVVTEEGFPTSGTLLDLKKVFGDSLTTAGYVESRDRGRSVWIVKQGKTGYLFNIDDRDYTYEGFGLGSVEDFWELDPHPNVGLARSC